MFDLKYLNNLLPDGRDSTPDPWNISRWNRRICPPGTRNNGITGADYSAPGNNEHFREGIMDQKPSVTHDFC